MEQAAIPRAEDDRPRVLVAGTSDGHRLELLEYGDGSFAITFDGAEEAIYRRGAANVESCMRTYLGMLRSRGH